MRNTTMLGDTVLDIAANPSAYYQPDRTATPEQEAAAHVQYEYESEDESAERRAQIEEATSLGTLTAEAAAEARRRLDAASAALQGRLAAPAERFAAFVKKAAFLAALGGGIGLGIAYALGRRRR